MKAMPDEIRERFDHDVERFSRLETGQSSTVDAPLVLDLISESAAAVTPHAKSLLDVGCGAGNYTLKFLERLPDLDCTLVDLSRPMLNRAVERVFPHTAGRVEALQADIREADLGTGRFDIIVAAAVLHHLREDAEWEAVFDKFFAALRPGGSLWISDLVSHSRTEVQSHMWRRYGEYLESLKDPDYREHVFDYVEFEDTPRAMTYQLDLLRRTGFEDLEVLHKHNCFAAFGAVRPARQPG
jgi:tRNA (cmo5U34)-methyltransferase